MASSASDVLSLRHAGEFDGQHARRMLLLLRLAKGGSMTQEEWVERYQRRFVEVAGVTASQAVALADTEDFSTLSEFYEDDPEGAADEEMSCWESDAEYFVSGTRYPGQ